MTQAELAVTAALGASFLTGLASLGVMWFREYLRGKAADRDALVAAVTEMLSRSVSVSMRAQTMGETMRQRSGLGEGFNVAMRHRKLLDHFEMHDWMAQDMAPLNAAWSVIWARGDQELIRRANALVSSCADLLGVSTARMPAVTAEAKLRREVTGERWTPEMLADLEKSRKEMANAREQLAQYARHVLRLPEAQLFGHQDRAASDEPGLGETSAESDAAAVATTETAPDMG